MILGPHYILPVIVFIFFGFRWDGVDGTHRMFSPVFILLAMVVTLAGSGLLHSIGAGALLAMASFFTQQRGGVALVAIAVFVIFDQTIERKRLSETAGRLSTLCGSYAVTLLVLVGWFAYSAGIGVFLGATLEYPARYYGYANYNNLSALMMDIAGMGRNATAAGLLETSASVLYLAVLPAAVVCFWIFLARKRDRSFLAAERGIILCALVATVLTFTVTAPNVSRMYQISMPTLMVLIWLIGRTGAGSQLFASTRRTAVIAAVFIVFGFIQGVRVQTSPISYLATPTGRLAYWPSPIIDARYGYLLSRTQPGDTVFEAYQPYIYFPLLLKNPTRYGQIWPSDYTRPEHVEETLRALSANPPRFILWNNDYNKPAGTRAAGDHIGPLSEFLQSRYLPVGEQISIPEGNIQIWERKN